MQYTQQGQSAGVQAHIMSPCALDAKHGSAGFDGRSVVSMASHLLSSLLFALEEWVCLLCDFFFLIL